MLRVRVVTLGFQDEKGLVEYERKYPLAVSGNRRKQLNSANSGRGAEMPPDVFYVRAAFGCGGPHFKNITNRGKKSLQIDVWSF